MKKLLILFILFMIISIATAFNISINSIGHEVYGVELCTHNGNCTYYNAKEAIEINNTKDYLLKIVHVQKNLETDVVSDLLNDFDFLLGFIVIVVIILLLYILIKHVIPE